MAQNVSALNQVAVALGTSTYGTAAVTFSRGLLVTNFEAKGAEQAVEPVGEIRGDFSVRRVTVPPHDFNFSLGFALDVGDTGAAGVGDFLAAILGTDTGTTSDVKFKHKLAASTSQTPPWLNIWCDKDYQARQITGCRPTEITFEIDSSAGMIPVSVSGIAKTEGNLDVSSMVFTFSNEPIITPAMAGTFTIGGSPVTNFSKATITIASDVERFRPISNSKDITAAYRKDLSITINIEGLDFANETERAKFKAVSTSSLQLKLTDGNSNYVDFYFPQVNYQTWESPSISGSDLKTLSASMLVTGDLASAYIEILNTYGYNYGTGAVIS